MSQPFIRGHQYLEISQQVHKKLALKEACSRVNEREALLSDSYKQETRNSLNLLPQTVARLQALTTDMCNGIASDGCRMSNYVEKPLSIPFGSIPSTSLLCHHFVDKIRTRIQ